MSRIARVFLVWALAIALPAQGMAASRMLFCGPSHERMMHGLVLEGPVAVRAHAQTHDHHPVQGTLAVAHGQHGDGDAGDVTVPGAAAGDEADAAQPLMPHHGQFSCSACSACSPLALPAQLVLSLVAGPVHAVVMRPASPIASQPPDGLDRPPRSVLA